MSTPLWRHECPGQDAPLDWQRNLPDIVKDTISPYALPVIEDAMERMSHQATEVLSTMMEGKGPLTCAAAGGVGYPDIEEWGSDPEFFDMLGRCRAIGGARLEVEFEQATEGGLSKEIEGALKRLMVFAPDLYDARMRKSTAAGTSKPGFFDLIAAKGKKKSTPPPPIKE